MIKTLIIGVDIVTNHFGPSISECNINVVFGRCGGENKYPHNNNILSHCMLIIRLVKGSNDYRKMHSLTAKCISNCSYGHYARKYGMHVYTKHTQRNESLDII